MAVIKPVNSVFEEIDGQLISPLSDGNSNPFVSTASEGDNAAGFQAELDRLAAENEAKIRAEDEAAAAKLKAENDAALAKLLADEEAFKKQQSDLDASTKAQLEAQARADADAFARAQGEIAAMVAAEQQRMDETAAAYQAQQAAAQAAADQATREAEAAQAEIARQLAETQRISTEMAAKSKSETEAIQRTSAAKIAGSRKAGRSAGDRSLLAGYGAADTGAPTLGGGGSLGGKRGSLGISGILGV